MNVLILGASGLVGGNILTYLSGFVDYAVRGTHFSFPTDATCFFNTADLSDLANADALHEFFPDVVVHCGALTFVDYCEQHPEVSFEKTVSSTRNALELARQHKAMFVYISTDYVFDGQRGPYMEKDAVNPICVYGAHKLQAEQLVQQSGLPYLILRITNVYGTEVRGKNFIARLLTQMQNSEQIRLSLPYDQYATPINALDVARALKLLLDQGRQGIYHLAGTDYLNRYQLADRVISNFAYDKASLTPVTTATLPQQAPRPLKAGLLAHKFLSEFPDFRFSNVDDFLKNNPDA
ncbi:MAG: dTDP-4-dehydrorhamnose reductase [Hymenobacter sp.]|jgi:dTDP-4-dehydrorhamnose reductase|nr:dTDP-4-dehydrorhamnose reductase [Hymenobacter sp.]